MFEFRTKLQKYQLASLVSTALANALLFLGTLTPAWQVAMDQDAQRYVESGLWLYCPGSAQCWYIFSDSLINYYEKVDVCRFFLIGDCRKKLLRTPYFFGWHYAVLILNVFSMTFMTLGIAAIIVAYLKKNKVRLFTIIFDVMAFLACLFLGISLMVFMINAEMLESKYLIGIKNTFEKEYGYSFYLAGLAFLISTFSMMFAVLVTTYTFFFVENYEDDDEYSDDQYPMKPATNMSYPPSHQVPSHYQSQLTTQIPATEHGSIIMGSVSPAGQFKSQTRHFYSY
ncbi:unnamed protein product [Caenorhabditis angaria]|uniref:Uncharacterized protein n=1 Tax=Caenorhabditis angaria TaxID=860376 RepID=A0A9P1NAM2_9PELO|nr:unnamed protein product [Caenorhabditis angaria]